MWRSGDQYVASRVAQALYSPSVRETSLIPRDTLAGTAAWLIQKETQDMATRRTEGM